MEFQNEDTINFVNLRVKKTSTQKKILTLKVFFLASLYETNAFCHNSKHPSWGKFFSNSITFFHDIG